MMDFAIGGAVAIPVIVAIVQALKMVGLPGKFAPIVSIGVGILLSFFVDHGAIYTIGNQIIAGIVFGLSASGLYSGTIATTNVVQGGQNER